MPFFPIFYVKIAAHMPILCQKKRPFSQKHCALMSNFSNFHEKPPAAMPIFGQKNINSVKAPLHFGHVKITAHMPILY